MPLSQPRFARPSDRVEHAGSALALILLLSSWIVGYVALCPAEPIQHHAHIAKVRA